jgi:lysophospholipase L1-like esterase
VQCTASDSAGRSASCTFNVTVTAPQPRLTRTRFLAFGDSMTAGEVAAATGFGSGQNTRLVLDPASSYPTRLQALLRARYTAQASTIDVINAGRSGEWAQDGASRFESVVSTARPEVVILFEGANDLGALGDRGVNVAASALDRMARTARGRGIRVMMATLPPPRPGGIRTLPDAQVRELNNRIRAIAGGEGAVLVDLYGGLRVDLNRYIGVDGLHPTAAGYERIAELMLQAIRTTFEAPSS